MLSSQPLNTATAHSSYMLCAEIQEMSVMLARQYYSREFLGGSKCHLSRAEIVRRVRSFCDRLVTTEAQVAGI